jgi:hypothetical protein
MKRGLISGVLGSLTLTLTALTVPALTHTTQALLIAIPQISSVSPASVQAGSAGFTITVTGSFFSATSTVDWNGTALAATTYNSGTGQLQAPVPATLIANVGTAQITVTETLLSATSAPQPFYITQTSAAVTATNSANSAYDGIESERSI